MDSEITLRMDNWRGGDETQNGAHVMRRRGCAMQKKGIKKKSGQFSSISACHLYVFPNWVQTKMSVDKREAALTVE